jgi:hypothetical protein
LLRDMEEMVFQNGINCYIKLIIKKINYYTYLLRAVHDEGSMKFPEPVNFFKKNPEWGIIFIFYYIYKEFHFKI